MFKTDSKVQAALAFGVPLKPLERQEAKRNKSDDTSKHEGHKDGKGKITNSKSDSACRGTKLKRKANGLNDEGPSGTTPQKQTAKKRSIAAVQPQQGNKESCKLQPSKKVPVRGQVGKASCNPVFARSKQKVCLAMETVDLTTTNKKAPVSSTCHKPKCPFSSALPPVHVLQGGDCNVVAHSCTAARARKISHRCGGVNLEPHQDSAASPFFGSHLQQEDHVSLVSANKQEGVDAGISRSLYERIKNHVRGQGTAMADGLLQQADKGGEQGQQRPIAYMKEVMQSLQHDYHCNKSPSAGHLWVDQLGNLQEQARRAAHEQLPWVHKYAPEVADRVLENSTASKELLTWLKQVEPIEAALTSMRSGHMTDSNAMSSWKADSDDSDFDQGHGTRQFTGVGGMIISGPHGCGKSAAVYACAQELGIQVLEINPGMDRTGTMLLRLIGEATQSHRVQWGSGGQADEAATGGMKTSKSSSMQGSKQKSISKGRKRSAHRSDCPSADQPVLPGATAVQLVPAEDQQAAGQLAQRSLLLFEDFDQLLDRDEGFLASVASLLNKSKIAVVLLSERPNAEAVLRGTATCASIKSVQMRAPSHASVIEYLGLVCAAEEHYVHPAMLHRLAFSCNGDLRSALQQLQFIACQKRPEGSDDELQQHKTLSAMPRHLSWIYAPASGEPTLRSVCMADGIVTALRDYDWACASLQQVSSPHPNAVAAPDSRVCGPIVPTTVQPSSAGAVEAGVSAPQTQHSGAGGASHASTGGDVVPEARCEAGVAHERACADENADAANPQQAGVCVAAGQALGSGHPPWMSAVQCQRDLAAAAVLDAWAEALHQRQQALCPNRTKRRSPQSSAPCSPDEGRPATADTSALGQGQLVPVMNTELDVQQAKDVPTLEDDVPTGVELALECTPGGGAGVGLMSHLASGNSGPSCGSGSTRELPSRPCRPVLDDSDEGENDGGSGDCRVSPVLAPHQCLQANEKRNDEEAITAAVLAEMVTRCQDAEAVCSSAYDSAMRAVAFHGTGGAECGAAIGQQGGCQGDAATGGEEHGAGKVPSDGVSDVGQSIAAAAAAAGVMAAAAASAQVCGGAADAVPCPADVAAPISCAPTESVADQPKTGSECARKGSDAAAAPAKRRGRPRKDTSQTCAAHAASRAAVVLQQGREAMSRHIEHVQRQAAELRSACSAGATVLHAAPVAMNRYEIGTYGAGDLQAEVSKLEWACTKSEILSASDVYARCVAESCSAGVSGMPGEWLWLGDDVSDEGVLASDARPASGACTRSEGGCDLEQAVSGVRGALWGCCGSSMGNDDFRILRHERSVERRMEMVERVRFGTRDCSRHSLFDSWHALGCMAHDECAVAAAQSLEGAVPRRTRRKRGHCAEAVFVWDIDVPEIDAAALAWSQHDYAH